LGKKFKLEKKDVPDEVEVSSFEEDIENSEELIVPETKENDKRQTFLKT